LIDAMRTLALDYLVQETAGDRLPANPDGWYQNLRNTAPEMIYPYLVEDAGKIEAVYILEMVSEEIVRMSVWETDRLPNNALPFMRPSGSQSPQVGPVIKRSYSKDKGGGPSQTIISTTMNYFKRIAQENKPWSPYFKDILKILNCPKVEIPGEEIIDWQKRYPSLLSFAVDRIGEQNNTVFLTVRDSKGLLPGDNKSYVDYLLTEKLAGERYATNKAPAREGETCHLCGAQNTTVFPNALKGAGINFSNVDRAGAFPGIDPIFAWKGYGLCAACADLLYVYKFHVLKKAGPKKNKQPFGARIAGDNALIIPSFLPGLSTQERQEVFFDVGDYINRMSSDVAQDEDSLLDTLMHNNAILNLNFLWADIGQNIENVTGMITNVLPSRLRELSDFNAETDTWEHPLFPRFPLKQGRDNFKPDLSLKALGPLFRRPGGKKAREANESKQLFQAKRLIAACVYHCEKIPVELFWSEVMTTARWHLLEAIEKKDGFYGLLYEGSGKKGAYLTAAGWIRHLAWWVYYFKKLEVLDMEVCFFEPRMESLKPYFGPESGIDTLEKAYAFLLGVLYGKVMQVQGARGVNVGANALTWLKRLTLKGKDLPELYIKTREKLLAYETEKNPEIRNLISEIGRLGVKLGDKIELNETQANYYLLLGQSMLSEILPTEKEKTKGVNKNG